MDAQADLDSQQKHLASIDYDLRITNLARFIHKKIKEHFVPHELDSGSLAFARDDMMPKRVRHDGSLSLIDIGAGNGLFLKFFKNEGLEVTGIEYEHHLVDKMKKDPQLKDISISQGDITKVTGREEFDVVIASDVIEHIKDHEKAVQHLWTYVAPGGILIITVPAHSFLYGKRDEDWGHFRRYDKKVLKNVLEKNAGPIEFITFWNFVGFFVYFLYEKILHKKINEEIRYSSSISSKIVRSILDSILKFEEQIGGSVLGLTLIAGVKKTK